MIAHWWILLVIFITLIFSSVVFANPFDSFENELKDYIDSSNNQNIDLDPELRELFKPDQKGEDPIRSYNGYSTVSSNYKLPSHISITRLISTTVVNSGKSKSGSYKVKPKDTLSAIARKFKTTVVSLKRLNGLKSDIIRIGQNLRISSKGSKYKGKSSTIYKMRVFAMPVLNGRVTSKYGYRRDPFNPNIKNFHSGLDLSAPVGTPVIAAADGVVEFKGRNGGYGNTVIVRHKGGYKTIYAHCSSTVVEKGDVVKMGTVLGSVGRTGTATGAHLHFEVMHRGKFINPQSALRKVEIVVGKPITKNTKS
ncbi:MAG: peptidoglycan DD-metalloendopeptidase family protein [Leptospiraceae bacterium]|nr:peptidoglycan DD-metalloendopeptidase family protein [Leptospiraceae bacterium]